MEERKAAAATVYWQRGVLRARAWYVKWVTRHRSERRIVHRVGDRRVTRLSGDIRLQYSDSGGIRCPYDLLLHTINKAVGFAPGDDCP